MGYHIDTDVQISQFLQQLTLMVYYFTMMLYGPKLPTHITIRANLMHQIIYYCPLDKISVILALFDHKPTLLPGFIKSAVIICCVRLTLVIIIYLVSSIFTI